MDLRRPRPLVRPIRGPDPRRKLPQRLIVDAGVVELDPLELELPPLQLLQDNLSLGLPVFFVPVYRYKKYLWSYYLVFTGS